MFWSGNYIVVRELNSLLKEQNVTLTQVLEADDILQECKADNVALIQFLIRPEILAELVTLITEEPPRDVELANQYRHASVACEVLTSHLSMLSDRLSSDAVQMNRLCDFINRHPPLNPLLASYFSKTVEMLLERSPKQDWYLYHIVCLRVLDFFKARRDFLPNLLRHISTSAIADIFKYFIRLDELFNKVVMEWFEEHHFLESMVQIICGTYCPGEVVPARRVGVPTPAAAAAAAPAPAPAPAGGNDPEAPRVLTPPPSPSPSPPPDDRSAVAASNAAGLLCDVILNDCASDLGQNGRSESSLARRLRSAETVRLVLGGVFTCPARRRRSALVHGARLLAALTHHHPVLPGSCWAEGEEANPATQGAGPETQGAPGGGGRGAVELAVAPHLPLLHQALLRDVEDDDEHIKSSSGEGEGGERRAGAGAVGAARVEVATLLAQLAVSEVDEVASTMITLGTPGVLLDMFFRYKDNNFLHAQVCNYIRAALQNLMYRTEYGRHLLLECDILNRLMDVFEENENNAGKVPRAGNMGHVILMLKRLSRDLDDYLVGMVVEPPAEQYNLPERWTLFCAEKLQPVIARHDTALGGYYPSDNIYEVESMEEDIEGGCCDFNNMATAELDDLTDLAELGADAARELGIGSRDFLEGSPQSDSFASRRDFMQMAEARFDNMWDEQPAGGEEDDACGEGEGDGDTGEGQEGGEGEGGALPDPLRADPSPWDTPVPESSTIEGWAQFDAEFSAGPAPPAPVADPPAPPTGADAPHGDFWTYGWGGDNDEGSSRTELEHNLQSLRLDGSKHESRPMDEASVELANNLLTAMSSMAPDVIANIVNANMTPCHDDTTCPPHGARQSPPRDTRQSPPRDARQSPPRDARQSPPRDDRQSPPRDARQSPPRDARQSPPRDVTFPPHIATELPQTTSIERCEVSAPDTNNDEENSER